MNKSDRPFSHPNFGKQARVEWDGCEVRLCFTANTPEQASSLAESLVRQLKAGALNLTMLGKPSKVTET